MEVIAIKLIQHNYTETELLNNCSPDTLKDLSLEWNDEGHKNHKFATEIKESNIVFSIKHISTKEEYGYFFFNVIKAPEGNYAFIIKKVVLDINLTESYIKTSVCNVIELLNNGNFLRKDRLISNNNYPLTTYDLENTKIGLSNEILSLFHQKSTGQVEFSKEFEDKLRDIAQKMNAPK